MVLAACNLTVWTKLLPTHHHCSYCHISIAIVILQWNGNLFLNLDNFGFSGVSYKLNYIINLFKDLLEVGERTKQTNIQYLNFIFLKTAYRIACNSVGACASPWLQIGITWFSLLDRIWPAKAADFIPALCCNLPWDPRAPLLAVWLNTHLCLLSHDQSADVPLIEHVCTLAKGQKMCWFGRVTGDSLRPQKVFEICILCHRWNAGHFLGSRCIL